MQAGPSDDPNDSMSSGQCVALVLEYLRDHPQPELTTPVDVINFVCRVVEQYDKSAKTAERGTGEQKKVLAMRLLRESLPELRAHRVISSDLCDQTRMVLSDRDGVSTMIDSVIRIWNEIERSGICYKLSCCVRHK
jgi:hypothetical protein